MKCVKIVTITMTVGAKMGKHMQQLGKEIKKLETTLIQAKTS